MNLLPELVDRVIDYCHDNVDALSNLSLVSSQTLPAARHHIFSTISIQYRSRFKSFAELLSSELCTIPYDIDLLQIGVIDWELDVNLFAYFRRATRIYLTEVGIHGDFEKLRIFKTVQEIRLNRCKFVSSSSMMRLVKMSPLVKSVTLKANFCKASSTPVPLGAGELRLSLQQLTVRDSALLPDILDWAVENCVPHTIKHLEIATHSQCTNIQQLVDHCAESLEVLIVYGSYLTTMTVDLGEVPRLDTLELKCHGSYDDFVRVIATTLETVKSAHRFRFVGVDGDQLLDTTWTDVDEALYKIKGMECTKILAYGTDKRSNFIAEVFRKVEGRVVLIPLQ